MSNKIDEKIVEMKFDNKQFESGISQSMNSIKNLNSSVAGMSDSAAKGLDNLDKSSSKLNFAGLTDAVGLVSERFSVMETIAIGALMRIGQQAVDAGERLVKSIAIAPIKQGFDEYELKMQSVQTIMASTGEDIGVVNSYLEELNTYSDKTIYSFSDMTNNIGKFTNNGVKLDDAVKAIQGISNEAALAGANTQEASRAMYNFSQALSQGSVKLIDWKSIENANMATQAFKQNLLDTALAMGTVKKEGDKYVSVTTDANGKVSAAFDSVQNFNDSLSSQWMTTEVLVQTLQNYSTDVREMTEAEKAEYEEKLKGLGYTEEQIKSIEELGTKAFDAAQDVKTFSQLVDTLQEAVGSGWSQTFEILFGDLEEAKKLWTGVSNVIGGIIDSSSKSRNAILTRWDDLGGRSKMIKALSNIFKNLLNITHAVSEGFRQIFPKVTGDALARFSYHFVELTQKLMLGEEQLDKIKRAVAGFLSPFGLLKDLIFAVAKGFKPLINGLVESGDGFLTAAANLGDYIRGITIAIKKLIDFDEITERVSGAVSAFAEFIGDLYSNTVVSFIEGGGKLSGVMEVLFDTLANVVRMLFDMASALTGINFDHVRDTIVTAIQSIRNVVVEATGHLDNATAVLKDRILGFIGVIRGSFENGVLGKIFSGVADAAGKMLDKVQEVFIAFGHVDMGGVDEFSDDCEQRFSIITAIFNGIKDLFEALGRVFEKLSPVFKKVGQVIGTTFGKIIDAVVGFFKNSSIKDITDMVTTGVFAYISLSLKDLIKSISGVLDGIGDSIGSIAEFSEGITGILTGVKDCLAAYQKEIQAKTLVLIATAVGILAVSLLLLSTIDKDKMTDSLSAVVTSMTMLITAMKSLLRSVDTWNASSTKVLAAGVSMVLMGEAVLLIAGALKMISSIDEDSLVRGVAVLSLVIAELVISFKSIAKTLDERNTKGMTSAMLGLIPLTAAVLLLAKAVEKFGELDTATLVKGSITLVVVLKALSSFVKEVGGSKNMFSIGTGLLVLSAAMIIFAEAIEKIGELKVSEIIKGVGAIVVVLKALESFVSGVSGAKKMITISTGMTILGAAMIIFSNAIEKIGALDVQAVIRGLGAIVVVLEELKRFGSNMSGAKNMLGVSVFMTTVGGVMSSIADIMVRLSDLDPLSLGAATAAITVILTTLSDFAKKIGNIGSGIFVVASALNGIGSAMIIFAEAVEKIGMMDLEVLATGLVGVIAVMIIMTKLFDSFSDNKSSKLMASAFAMQIVAASLVTLAAAMGKFGDMSLEELAKGLAAMAGSLLILVTAMVALGANSSGTIKGATAIGIIAPAILALSVALKILSTIPVVGIIASVGAIALAITILGGAAKLLGPILPMFASLSASLLMLGVACVTCGAGVFLFATSLSLLAVDGAAGLAVLTTAVKTFLPLIPTLAKNLGLAIVELIRTFADGLVETVASFGRVIEAILQLVIQYGPVLIETVINLIDELLKSLAKHLPSFVDSGISMVESLIEGIDSHIDVLIADLVSLISNAINALAEQSYKLVDAGINLVLNLIEGLGQGIEDHAEDLRDALLGFLEHLWEAILKFFGIHSPSTKMMEVGWNLIKGLAQGIWDMLKWIVGEIGKFIGKLLAKFGEILGKIFDVGKDIIKWLVDGIKEIAGDVWEAIKGAITAVGDKIVEIGATVLEWGKKVIGWIVDGVKEIAGDVWDAVKGAFTAITDKIGDIWDTVKGWGKKVVGWICDGIKALVSDPWNAVKDALTYIGDKIVGFGATLVGYGKKIFSHIKDGFDEIKGYLGGTIEDELKAAYQVINGPHGMGEELRQAMKKLGGDMNEGLAKGMEDSMNTVNKQIDNTSSSIVERMKSKNNLNINSPSKVFAAIGASIDEGLAKGIDDYSYYALSSIDGLSTETISSFDGISEAIENIASDNVAYMPTVRPVLDSTNLVGSLADISSINPQAALNLTADLNYNIGDEIASGMRDLVTNNNRMIETLNGVRNDLDELYSVVGNLKVVMDTGALVGQIATPIDYALGRNVRLSGRGV